MDANGEDFQILHAIVRKFERRTRSDRMVSQRLKVVLDAVERDEVEWIVGPHQRLFFENGPTVFLHFFERQFGSYRHCCGAGTDGRLWPACTASLMGKQYECCVTTGAAKMEIGLLLIPELHLVLLLVLGLPLILLLMLGLPLVLLLLLSCCWLSLLGLPLQDIML